MMISNGVKTHWNNNSSLCRQENDVRSNSMQSLRLMPRDLDHPVRVSCQMFVVNENDHCRHLVGVMVIILH